MKKFAFIFGIISLCIIGMWIWWQTTLLPVDGKQTTTQLFVVPEGASVHQVADDLAAKGLIKNSFAFLVYTKLAGLAGKLQKGDFQFAPSMSSQEIASSLVKGPMDIRLTIIPGKRADEIADLLKANIPTYQEDWRATLRLHEGYLFPDTYFFPQDATIDQIITIMTDNFNKKYQQATSLATIKLSQEHAVIIASILQREAPSGEDMKKVASVLENRLNIGMALQVDATVQYALGYQAQEHTWWKKNLTADDLKIDSPYNTYTQPGLPPTAISNPDLEALQAALNPADTNYLYYISDSKGVMHYAATLQEHNANIRKYGL